MSILHKNRRSFIGYKNKKYNYSSILKIISKVKKKLYSILFLQNKFWCKLKTRYHFNIKFKLLK